MGNWRSCGIWSSNAQPPRLPQVRAATSGNAQVVRYLTALCGEVGEKEEALREAAKGGHLEEVQCLAEEFGADVNSRVADTPLLWGAKCVRYLVEQRGVDANVRGWGQSKVLMRRLNAVIFTSYDTSSNTATLTGAAANGHIEIVRVAFALHEDHECKCRHEEEGHEGREEGRSPTVRWQGWFERMKLKLERKGVWKYCEKDIEEPEESKQDEHDACKKNSAHAKELLYDGMTDKIMKTVKFEPTALRSSRMIDANDESWTKVVKTKLCLEDLVEVGTEAEIVVVVVAVVLIVAEGVVLVVVVAEEAAKELDVVTDDKVSVEEDAFIVESNRTKCWTART
ncbi:hypothetical protein PHYSODRAFT_261406 [Phytophthora sojae]|uniref:Uncharacterized protein n=1 Tax=Phytophthora sojae (strain P6497) TaxID=1094619 RepID=G4ZDN5_PHYSP|nr:hypothetical protein PHYSODRAFT_261406 [Phytophthora sojae]EGZ18374.1 hypothetical protein PHYSODRAFT_261406 [Phytophthora sojae]|eukprot:XP_009527432.1 hypothetical protein PHYSODRAFT_261406 [Phytophthora sojae]